MSATSNRSSVVYRIIIGLFFFVLAVAAAFSLLVTTQLIDLRLLLGGWSYTVEPSLALLEGLSWTSRLGIAGGCAIIGLLAITVMLRQLKAPGQRARLHILESGERGFVVVDSRSISTIAAQAAMSAHGVIEVHVSVRGNGTSPVRLKVEAGVYPGANVKRCGAEMLEAVRETVESMVGIDVADVAVKAHVVETDAMTRILE
jgi:uncharacterized alkaline shock family protein YloU